MVYERRIFSDGKDNWSFFHIDGLWNCISSHKSRMVKNQEILEVGYILIMLCHIYKISFWRVTSQNCIVNFAGFAIINVWQHFGNRKSASQNK